jgi:choline dehydrogenase-like flavoprotein
MSKPDHVDVVVIGAGTSGAIHSLVLAQAGFRIVCLDQGGWTEPAQHPHFSDDFQYQRHNRWSPEPGVRKGPDDYPVLGGQSHALMWNGVGGSTNVYAALWPRFRPSDFRKGREHGLAPDWPITYEDLAPFYDEADRLIGVSGLTGDPGMPPRTPYPLGPLPMRGSGRAIAKGFDALGWHWWPMPAGIISEDYDGRASCNGCGNCASGCPRGSMAKMSITHWPKAIAAGTDLRPGARVERIETGADGRATGVVYIDRATGERVLQTAEVVIVAANGVGSPRMLLMSDNARHPNGLANGNDVVGRYLLHHTLVAAEIWVDEPINSHIGNSGAIISSEFAETDIARGFVNGFNFNVARTGPAGAAAIGSFGHRAMPWGEGHHAWFKRHFGHSFGAYAIGDDLPQPSNRITLSRNETDSDGLPAAKLHYMPHENDLRMMRYGIERLRDLARGVNAFDVAVTDYYENGVYRIPAWHMLGTCRMGADAESSVVNKWHQSWEVPNLYVCDGSSFTTGGVVNPTSTVTALALRSARNLAANFRELSRATKVMA